MANVILGRYSINMGGGGEAPLKSTLLHQLKRTGREQVSAWTAAATGCLLNMKIIY